MRRPFPTLQQPAQLEGHRGCWTLTNLAIISLPGQEAVASASIPDTDLARAGAAVEQRAGPIAE